MQRVQEKSSFFETFFDIGLTILRATTAEEIDQIIHKLLSNMPASPTSSKDENDILLCEMHMFLGLFHLCDMRLIRLGVLFNEDATKRYHERKDILLTLHDKLEKSTQPKLLRVVLINNFLNLIAVYVRCMEWYPSLGYARELINETNILLSNQKSFANFCCTIMEEKTTEFNSDYNAEIESALNLMTSNTVPQSTPEIFAYELTEGLLKTLFKLRLELMVEAKALCSDARLLEINDMILNIDFMLKNLNLHKFESIKKKLDEIPMACNGQWQPLLFGFYDDLKDADKFKAAILNLLNQFKEFMRFVSAHLALPDKYIYKHTLQLRIDTITRLRKNLVKDIFMLIPYKKTHITQIPETRFLEMMWISLELVKFEMGGIRPKLDMHAFEFRLEDYQNPAFALLLSYRFDYIQTNDFMAEIEKLLNLYRVDGNDITSSLKQVLVEYYLLLQIHTEKQNIKLPYGKEVMSLLQNVDSNHRDIYRYMLVSLTLSEKNIPLHLQLLKSIIESLKNPQVLMNPRIIIRILNRFDHLYEYIYEVGNSEQRNTIEKYKEQIDHYDDNLHAVSLQMMQRFNDVNKNYQLAKFLCSDIKRLVSAATQPGHAISLDDIFALAIEFLDADSISKINAAELKLAKFIDCHHLDNLENDKFDLYMLDMLHLLRLGKAYDLKRNTLEDNSFLRDRITRALSFPRQETARDEILRWYLVLTAKVMDCSNPMKSDMNLHGKLYQLKVDGKGFDFSNHNEFMSGFASFPGLNQCISDVSGSSQNIYKRYGEKLANYLLATLFRWREEIDNKRISFENEVNHANNNDFKRVAQEIQQLDAVICQFDLKDFPVYAKRYQQFLDESDPNNMPITCIKSHTTYGAHVQKRLQKVIQQLLGELDTLANAYYSYSVIVNRNNEIALDLLTEMKKQITCIHFDVNNLLNIVKDADHLDILNWINIIVKMYEAKLNKNEITAERKAYFKDLPLDTIKFNKYFNDYTATSFTQFLAEIAEELWVDAEDDEIEIASLLTKYSKTLAYLLVEYNNCPEKYKPAAARLMMEYCLSCLSLTRTSEHKVLFLEYYNKIAELLKHPREKLIYGFLFICNSLVKEQCSQADYTNIYNLLLVINKHIDNNLLIIPSSEKLSSHFHNLIFMLPVKFYELKDSVINEYIFEFAQAFQRNSRKSALKHAEHYITKRSEICGRHNAADLYENAITKAASPVPEFKANKNKKKKNKKKHATKAKPKVKIKHILASSKIKDTAKSEPAEDTPEDQAMKTQAVQTEKVQVPRQAIGFEEVLFQEAQVEDIQVEQLEDHYATPFEVINAELPQQLETSASVDDPSILEFALKSEAPDQSSTSLMMQLLQPQQSIEDNLARFVVPYDKEILSDFDVIFTPLHGHLIAGLSSDTVGIETWLYDEALLSFIYKKPLECLQLICFSSLDYLLQLLKDNFDYFCLKQVRIDERNHLTLIFDEASLKQNNVSYHPSELNVEISCQPCMDRASVFTNMCYLNPFNTMLFYDIKNGRIIDITQKYFDQIAVYAVYNPDEKFTKSPRLDIAPCTPSTPFAAADLILRSISIQARYIDKCMGIGNNLISFINKYKSHLSSLKHLKIPMETMVALFLSGNALDSCLLLERFDLLNYLFPMQSSNYIVDFRNVCRAQDEKLKQSSSLQQYAGFLAKALYNTFMHEKYVWNYLTPDGKAKFVNHVANYYHSLPFASVIDNEALCQAFSLELWGMFLQRILTTLHSKLINTQLLNQATLNSKEEFMDGVWLYLQRQPIAIRQHVAELLWDHHESNAKLEVAPTSRTPY